MILYVKLLRLFFPFLLFFVLDPTCPTFITIYFVHDPCTTPIQKEAENHSNNGYCSICSHCLHYWTTGLFPLPSRSVDIENTKHWSSCRKISRAPA